MREKSWIDLSEKVVVVTGGAMGIGEQLVRDLLNCGAKVAIVDRVEPKEHSEIETKLFFKADIRKKNEVETAIKTIAEKYGRIDALVNNAGVSKPRILIDYYGQEPRYEIHEEDFNFMVDINMKGTLFAAQAAARIMVKQKSGVIVNMSSCAGINGSQGHSVYAATKSAIHSFTMSWAKELAPYNIRVVCIAPDILDRTPANNDEKYRAQAYGRGWDINTPPEKFFEGYKKKIPMGRPGHLYEVSNLVNYLVSNYASYITGVTIPVSGGKSRC